MTAVASPSQPDFDVAIEVLQRAGMEHLSAARWWAASSLEREQHADRAEAIGRVVHFLRNSAAFRGQHGGSSPGTGDAGD